MQSAPETENELRPRSPGVASCIGNRYAKKKPAIPFTISPKRDENKWSDGVKKHEDVEDRFARATQKLLWLANHTFEADGAALRACRELLVCNAFIRFANMGVQGSLKFRRLSHLPRRLSIFFYWIELRGAARTRDDCVEELTRNFKKGLTTRTGGLLIHTP